jgi:hypothetical protein
VGGSFENELSLVLVLKLLKKVWHVMTVMLLLLSLNNLISMAHKAEEMVECGM